MFKEYSKNNQSYKLAAPKQSDAKPITSSAVGVLHKPQYGQDFIFGFAHILACGKNKLTQYNLDAPNEPGWLLPGAQWTNSPTRVQKAAQEIDRLIRLAGGVNLPMEAA